MWKSSFKYIILLILCLLHHGLAIFTIDPTNVTTCLGSPAVFTCGINESLPILWLINGTQPLSPPPSTLLTPGPGAQSTLSVTATSGLNGASVQCYYLPSVLSLPIVSPPAYLSIQAPPFAPTNLTITVLNATSVLLAWGPPSGAQSPSLFYRVLVTSGNGTLVYNKTVKELQLILTTPDPCDQLWANVTSVYGDDDRIVCIGNSTMQHIGGPPIFSEGNMIASLLYTNSSDKIEVKVTLVLPIQPETHLSVPVCRYKIIAVAENESDIIINKPCSELTNITILLSPKKLFNVSVTTFNAYDNKTFNASVSTFSVINVTANSSRLRCDYNLGSPAIGCMVYAKNSNIDVPYCRVLMRSSGAPVNTSLCNASYIYLTGPLNAGMYSIDAYDIESDGSVFPIPAIKGKSLQLTAGLPDNSTTTIIAHRDIVEEGTIIGGVIGVAIFILLIVVAISAVAISTYIKKRKVVQPDLGLEGNYKHSLGRTTVDCDGQRSASPQLDQMTAETEDSSRQVSKPPSPRRKNAL